MDTDELGNFDITIELSSNGQVVRVNGIQNDTNFAAFDKAYLLARKLVHRIEYIETKHKLELVVNGLNTKIQHLWIEDDGTFKLSEKPKENSHRIALSLLRGYPECRIDVDIIKETGVKKSTVNDQLLGKVKSVMGYFKPCEKGYTLTESGIDWLSTEVIPTLIQS